MLKTYTSGRSARGVTLIELMIALVLGLIVSGAALAFVASVMKSNADTIRATRLTQELRTTAEIIARDLRRARSVSDPVANIGTTPLLAACNAITPAATDTPPTASCVSFGYDCLSATSGVFKSIGLAGGKIRLLAASTGAPACPSTSTGTQLSSDIVTINNLTITALSADSYTIRLTGRFTNDPDPVNPLIRRFTQEVRIRSSAVN